MNQRKLTKRQKLEFRSWLQSEGVSSTSIEGLMSKPSQAWDSYQRMKRDCKPVSSSQPDNEIVKAPQKKKGRGPGRKLAKITTSVQLDSDLLEGLQELSKREERSVSALIRLAIREYLNGRDL